MLVTAAVWTVVVPYPFSDIAVPLALQPYHCYLLTYLLIRLYYPYYLLTTGTARNTKMQDDGEGCGAGAGSGKLAARNWQHMARANRPRKLA